MDINLCYLFYQ